MKLTPPTVAFASLMVSLTLFHSATRPVFAADEAKKEAPKVDVSKLPPAATKKVDFAKDIQPIFKKSCIECHESSGAMGGFKLDKKEAAMKGGDSGPCIIPGKSEKSPLIHYVARLVKDMEMPPKDQGEPLTKEQIGLLRAWIDQGANWGDAEKK
jgi:mono/diheme cytochrome c family protein